MARFLFVLALCAAYASQAGQQIVQCCSYLAFYSTKLAKSGDGWLIKKGPKLKANRLSAYDHTWGAYYGDVVSFHANGLMTPDVQKKFSISIGYYDVSDVMVRIDDMRDSKFVKQQISFLDDNEHSLVFAVASQRGLVFENVYGDEELRSITLSCKRSP